MVFGFIRRNSKFTVTSPRKAWATVKAMKDYHKAHPDCAWCGRNADVDVHHIAPIHLSPELAADPLNMISLCRKPQCHLVIAHYGNFKDCNQGLRICCENHGRKVTK